MKNIAVCDGFIGRRPGCCYSMGISRPELSASGNPLLLNSAEAPLTALSLYGWSKQDGTPTPENPVPIVSAGDEGEINVTVQGGNLADVLNPDNWVYNAENGPYLSYKIPVPSGTYTISMSQNNMNKNYFTEHGINEAIALYFGSTPGIASPNKMIGNSGSTKTATATTTTTSVLGSVYLNLYYYSGSGQHITSFTREDLEYIFSYVPDFMLNAGSTALPYMPYKTPQTLTVQTPGGLPGIPVSSGGNYTDESGQQWICDEVDFKRGKYVQRVWRKTFDGSENWYRYSTFSGFYNDDTLESTSYRKPGFSNQFLVRSNVESTLPGLWIGVNNSVLYSVYNDFYDDSLEDGGLANWKAHLAAHPLEVMTYLETPIETDLSDEEMAAYKALHTYSPATTVSNDAEAWMKVGYYGLTAIQKLEKEALLINGGKS